MTLGQEGDDPVGLPQLDRAQHDPLVPVQVHYTSVILPPPPNILERPSYSATVNSEMFGGQVGFDGAEAALAALELGDRVEQVVAAEVGPADVGEHELRVGGLPDEEVRGAGVAAGAHERSGSGRSGASRCAGERVLVDRRHPHRPGLATSAGDRGHRRRPARPARRGRWRASGSSRGSPRSAPRSRRAPGAAAAADASSRRPRPADAHATGVQLVAPGDAAPASTSASSAAHLAERRRPTARSGTHLDGEPAQPDRQRAVDHVDQ